MTGGGFRRLVRRQQYSDVLAEELGTSLGMTSYENTKNIDGFIAFMREIQESSLVDNPTMRAAINALAVATGCEVKRGHAADALANAGMVNGALIESIPQYLGQLGQELPAHSKGAMDSVKTLEEVHLALEVEAKRCAVIEVIARNRNLSSSPTTQELADHFTWHNMVPTLREEGAAFSEIAAAFNINGGVTDVIISKMGQSAPLTTQDIDQLPPHILRILHEQYEADKEHEGKRWKMHYYPQEHSQERTIRSQVTAKKALISGEEWLDLEQKQLLIEHLDNPKIIDALKERDISLQAAKDLITINLDEHTVSLASLMVSAKGGPEADLWHSRSQQLESLSQLFQAVIEKPDVKQELEAMHSQKPLNMVRI